MQSSAECRLSRSQCSDAPCRSVLINSSPADAARGGACRCSALTTAGVIAACSTTADRTTCHRPLEVVYEAADVLADPHNLAQIIWLMARARCR